MKKVKNVQGLNSRQINSLITGINAKIVLTFIIVILVMGSISFIPLTMYKQPLSNYDYILKNIILANTTISTSNELKEVIRKLLVDVNNEQLRKEYDSKVQALNNTVIELEKGLMSEKSRTLFSIDKNLIATFLEKADKAVSKDLNIKISERSYNYEDIKRMSSLIDNNFKELISEEIVYSKNVRADLAKTTGRILILTLTILSGVLAVCMFVAFIIARSISIPVKSISNIADKVSSGDLSTDEIIISSKDELRLLADSFNKMIRNLKEMISKVSDSSGQVLQISDQLYQSATQSSTASEHIAVAIQEVAEGAENQAKLSEESALTIDGMYNIIEAISYKSAIAKESSETADRVTYEGNQSINKVINQINSLNITISEASLISDELFEQSKEIGKIVNAITSIASQTNLLALNAAIEAARAGAHGEGFAVVADEVRKLAEQSGSAANNITGIIKNIQSETAKMSRSMKKSMDEIKVSTEVTENAGKSFERINSSVSVANEQINNIYIEIQNMNNSIKEIKVVSDNIVHISKASAGSSQEVASSIEELSAGMQEVLSTTHVLNNMSNGLQELVRKFKL